MIKTLTAKKILQQLELIAFYTFTRYSNNFRLFSLILIVKQHSFRPTFALEATFSALL